MPPVFAGDSLTLFGRVSGGESGSITLSAGDESWQLDLDLKAAEEGGPVPTLWAREALRDLERGVGRGSRQVLRLPPSGGTSPKAEERRRRRMVELGRRYGLISSAASYVAVEERPEGERTEGAELRKIPIALTAGWGGRGRLVAGRRPTMPGSRPLAAPAFHDAVTYASARPRAASSMAGFAQNLGDRFQDLRKQVSLQRPQRQRAEPAKPSDRLYALLMTQKADGSFRLTAALKEWLGPHLAAAERAAAEHGEAAVATAVVIALLERDEAARQGEWRAAIRKARRWLERRTVDFDARALLEDAGTASEMH